MRAPKRKRGLGFFIPKKEFSSNPDVGFSIDINDRSKLLIALWNHLEDLCIP